jgi:hypothetical protein
MDVVTELGKKFDIAFTMSLPGECKITINHNVGDMPNEDLIKDIKKMVANLGHEVTNCETHTQIVVTYKV